MERMKAHGISPGATGEVIVTVGGKAVWGVVPGNEDELPAGGVNGDVLTVAPDGSLVWEQPEVGSGLPAVGPNGQVLTVVNGAAAWADPPAGGGGGGGVSTPVIMGSSSNSVLDGPYTCPLPPGIDANFDGLFVVAIHYDTAPIFGSSMVDGPITSGPGSSTIYEAWAWAGEPGQPGVLIVTGPPGAVVSVDTGGGAAQVFLLAVAGATVTRGDPGREVLVTDVPDLTGWSTRNGTLAWDDTYGVRAYAADAAPVGYLYAELDWNVTTDLTATRYVDVDWRGSDNLHNTPGRISATAGGVQLEVVSEVVSPLDSLMTRTTFRHPTGASVGLLRFRAGPFGNSGPGYDFWITNVIRRASSHALASPAAASGITLDDPGIPALAGDLLIALGGSQLDNATSSVGGTVVQSRNQEDYTGVVWSETVQAGGYATPNYGASGPSLETDRIAVAGIVLGGSSGGGTGGPIALDDLTDVNTTTTPPTSGEALLFDGTVWKPGPVVAGVDLEQVRDAVGALLVAGANITIVVDDAADTVTISAAGTDPEVVRDTIGSALVAGTGIGIVVNDAGDTITISSTVSGGLTAEDVRDTIGASLVAGSNVSIVVDDGADTITINATGGSTDPEVVRDTIAAMLVAGSGISMVYDDAADTFTITASGGGGGGATTLDGLADVDTSTTAPTDGQVLVFDSSTGLWKPGKGGVEVGSWENDLQTVIVYPAPVETMPATPLTLANGRQTTPTIELTVTAGMILSSGSDIGIGTGIFINLSVRRFANSGSGNPAIELGILRAATGIETSYPSNVSGPGTTLPNRHSGAVLTPPVAVGDKVRVRVWAGTNAADFHIDWWSYRPIATRIGTKAPPGGGAYLFRDIRVQTPHVGVVPTSTLTLAPTAWGSSSAIGTAQYADNGIAMGTNVVPDQNRSVVNSEATGVVTFTDGFSQTNYAQMGGASTTSAPLHHPGGPTQMRVDRLKIPTPLS